MATHSEDILPLSEHRAHLAENFRHIRQTRRPLFVTSNGKPAAVVLSPERYDELAEKAELLDNLSMMEESLQDFANGNVVKARDALNALARKRGLPERP